MEIEGRCHCGDIAFALAWPEGAAPIALRECSCTFCRKHGAAWTSHRDATLTVTLRPGGAASSYRFGTSTADFHVCRRCGAVPVATCDIDGTTYAVVNVNTFEGFDATQLARAPTSFDGEQLGDRLDRRKRNWIPHVTFTGPR